LKRSGGVRDIEKDSLANRRTRVPGEGLSGGMTTNGTPDDPETQAMRMELARLRLEHHDLEAAIDALTAVGPSDELQIRRLKKRKLALRDRIVVLEDRLTPNIIA
jgi:hypothetical protein